MIFELEDNDSMIRVSDYGATLLSWQQGGVEVLDGYRDRQELASMDGYRSAVLVPWVNRLSAAHWDDHDIRQLSGSLGIHGLFLREIFAGRRCGDTLEFTQTLPSSEVYSTALTVRVTYKLSDGLHVTISAQNVGDVTAPVALGWHPYFRASNIDDIRCKIRASKQIMTDQNMIPLAGDAAFVHLPSSWNEQPIPLTRNSDFSVTGIDVDADGWQHADVDTGIHRLALQMRSENPEDAVFHLYTGGTLQRDSGKSVAVEPCTAMADAFNRPELASKLSLAPGATRTLEIMVRVTSSAVAA